jgi:ribosomal protein L16 Arg81 hydroxylase
MNERIQELIGQCIDQRWTVTGPMFDKEKFAELIVRECLDIVANADMTGSWITHPKDVLYVACDQVKNHFGVQE